VDVSTPNHLHAAQSIAALEAGKHVACEKPLANTLAGARQMMEAAGSKAASLLGRRRTHAAASLHDTACGLMFELTPPLLDISATGIRQRIARGHSPRYLTPDSVWQQIQVSGLYGACPDGNF